MYATRLLALACVVLGAASQAADPATIDTVHVVSLCHLDAGYKYSFVSEVVSEWIQTWIPASIALSEEMRRKGGDAQHRWTMSPWIGSLLLDCPHDATWRAGAFPLHCPTHCG